MSRNHLSHEEKIERAVRALADMRQEDQLEAIARVLQNPKLAGRNDVDVDVTPFRERFLILQARDRLTADFAAERIGWLYGHSNGNGKEPKGDGTRLLRRLGLKAEQSGRGYYSVRRHINYEMAVDLCAAVELDYTEVDV